jgi:hypothetical protein
MTAAAGQAIDAAPSIAANCTGDMRRIPASGATMPLDKEIILYCT